ncbi:MAG: glycosyltransferase, partial [Syntrophobacterales bacterium]
MIKISVIVCTYNRAELLGGTLRTLCHQTLDTSEYEVIVVDNNSTDNTREVVDEFCRRSSNVRYCFEPQQGLSHARNQGLQEAKGKYVAYIDDDARA